MNSVEKNIPQGVWKLALAGSAAIWGGSFVVIKGALDVVPACWLMFIRFLGASVIVGALFNKNQYVGLAIPLSIVMAILIWIVLDKTRFGYELKATGFNRNAAKYCGMAEKRNVILSLVISGALAGMGAALLYLTGYEQWQCSTSSVPAMGFNGIAAAFLGGLNPLGTVLASFFIQHITAGGAYVDKSLYCAQISDLISSIIIYLCGFVLFMKHVMNSSIAKREEKAALKAKAAAEQDAANGKGGDQA